VRTFAFATAAVVVFFQLLPEAFDEIGIAALPVFAAALLLPATLERFAHAGHERRGHTHHPGEHADDHAPGLELGYLALAVHNFGDGVGIGTFGGPLRASDLQHQIALSIAAHTIPVTALFVVAFASQRGVRSALLRAVGLGVAVVAGALFASIVPASAAAPFEPWIAAGVAGLLLHVIAHDWPVQRMRSRRERTLDVIAFLAGLTLVLLAGGHDVGVEQVDPHGRIGGAFLGLALEAAPVLLLGLLAEAARRALRGEPIGSRAGSRAQSRGADPDAAAATGAPRATPTLRADMLFLSIGFLGIGFAVARLLGALAVAKACALAAPEREAISTLRAPPSPPSDSPGRRGLRAHLDALLFESGAWMAIGLLAATYALSALSQNALSGASHGSFVVLVAALVGLAGASYPPALVPLAAVLVAKGLSPGAALAALLMAPACDVARSTGHPQAASARDRCAALAAALSVAWLAGVVLDASPLVPAVGRIARDGAHGFVAWISLGVVGALFLRAIWRRGLRAWLGALATAPFARP
jgi:uncharacterized protein